DQEFAPALDLESVEELGDAGEDHHDADDEHTRDRRRHDAAERYEAGDDIDETECDNPAPFCAERRHIGWGSKILQNGRSTCHDGPPDQKNQPDIRPQETRQDSGDAIPATIAIFHHGAVPPCAKATRQPRLQRASALDAKALQRKYACWRGGLCDIALYSRFAHALVGPVFARRSIRPRGQPIPGFAQTGSRCTSSKL